MARCVCRWRRGGGCGEPVGLQGVHVQARGELLLCPGRALLPVATGGHRTEGDGATLPTDLLGQR